MRSSCFLHLVLVLPCLGLARAQDVKASSCFMLSALDGKTRTTFLFGDGAGARSLYFALWSEDKQLLSCRVLTDPLVTEEYHRFCNRNETLSEEIQREFNVSALLAPDAPCAQVSKSAPKFPGRTPPASTAGRSRRKRAWIFPGTLWCGSGSKAIGYEQLGMFESADRCCREHDHCLHIIPAFTVNYGVFNSHFYTVSHCECDQRFRECLLGVNDSISSMVGYSFFNILQVPCFELKQLKRCTEMYWWGMCKIAKVAPYAVFKNALPYNTSEVKSNYADHHSSTPGSEQHYVTTASLDGKVPQIKHTCGSRDPPRGDTFKGRLTQERRCRKRQQQPEGGPTHTPPSSRTLTTTVASSARLLNSSTSLFYMSKRITTNKTPTDSLLDDLSQKSPSSTTQPNTTTAPRRDILQHLTTAAVSQSDPIKKDKLVPKGNLCCKFRKPARGDTFQPACQICPQQETAPPVLPAATAAAHLMSTKLATTPRVHLSNVLMSAKTNATHKPRTASNRPQEHVDTEQTWRNPSRGTVGREQSYSSRREGSHRANYPSHNETAEGLCGSLRVLDECTFTIPSLRKKYELQNLDSKTAYHCNCTSRFAAQIKSLERLGTLPSLLMDFVSKRCFTLPRERICPNRESCSPGFTEASDLHRALKKIERKETAWVQVSRKRGIPVRLYKRCLRLQREVDFMATRR